MSWINAQIEWLKSFLSEPINGSGKIDKGSSKRLASVSVIATFVFITIKTALKTEAIPDIPDTWWFLIASILGITGIIDYFKNRKG